MSEQPDYTLEVSAKKFHAMCDTLMRLCQIISKSKTVVLALIAEDDDKTSDINIVNRIIASTNIGSALWKDNAKRVADFTAVHSINEAIRKARDGK